MALRGAHIFNGYMRNKGMVRVYQDLDNPKFVFAVQMQTGEEIYTRREMVNPRKTKTIKVKAPSAIQVTAPTTDSALRYTQECLF